MLFLFLYLKEQYLMTDQNCYGF